MSTETFNRAAHQERGEKFRAQRKQQLEAEKDTAQSALLDAFAAETRARNARLAAEKVLARRTDALAVYTARLAGPVVDVVDTRTGEIVSTGIVTADADPLNPRAMFTIDARASFAADSFAIVPTEGA
jgi:hypothetical protein